MGIRSFEHYIQKVDDDELKRRFQSMQQEVKLHAHKLAERIQNLKYTTSQSTLNQRKRGCFNNLYLTFLICVKGKKTNSGLPTMVSS
ncbi:DUF2383 domain-containing protein [Neobacillus niacini]|uniref:DUF2383 domain-containing protein n=1 Tax=Neobacillus niacini TaxID=86668 RepID=UPI0009DD3FED